MDTCAVAAPLARCRTILAASTRSHSLAPTSSLGRQIKEMDPNPLVTPICSHFASAGPSRTKRKGGSLAFAYLLEGASWFIASRPKAFSLGLYGHTTISEIGSVVLVRFLFWFGRLALWLWWSCLRQAIAQRGVVENAVFSATSYSPLADGKLHRNHYFYLLLD